MMNFNHLFFNAGYTFPVFVSLFCISYFIVTWRDLKKVLGQIECNWWNSGMSPKIISTKQLCLPRIMPEHWDGEAPQRFKCCGDKTISAQQCLAICLTFKLLHHSQKQKFQCPGTKKCSEETLWAYTILNSAVKVQCDCIYLKAQLGKVVLPTNIRKTARREKVSLLLWNLFCICARKERVSPYPIKNISFFLPS